MNIRNRIREFRMVKAADLHANPKNWRKHPKAQREALRGVLAEVGYVDAVIARELPDGRLELIDGHLRTEETPDQEVPCLIVDLDDTEAAKVLTTFDPLTGLAEADTEKLKALMQEFTASDPRVERLVQFTARDMKIELEGREEAEAPEPQIDRAAELQKEWGTELGQLWEIPGKAGVHRVLCGDSTLAGDVERVMGGEKAGAVVTDPPYGIERDGIQNDDPDGLRALFDGCLSAAAISSAVFIAFQSPRLEWVWTDSIRAAGHGLERVLWLHKSNDVCFPWRHWMMNGEAIRVSSIGDPEWGSTESVQDCYTITHDLTGGKLPHPTIKPLKVVVDLVAHTAGNVYDPFIGSGTTLIAAEQLGRVCYGIEISPAYVAVILQRTKDAGLTPRLADNTADNEGPW